MASKKQGTKKETTTTPTQAGKTLKVENHQKTIDQMSIARLIADKFGYKLYDIISVIEEEQKLTMEYAKMGYKVIKKNYLTIEGRKMEGKKDGKVLWTAKSTIYRQKHALSYV